MVKAENDLGFAELDRNRMTVWNLGSINADDIYRVPRLPREGETIHATELQRFLGGKGANMSVAAARAGAHVSQIGAVGSDGAWARERLLEYGVDTRHILTVGAPTGHAVVNVSDDGDNQIVILAGANGAIPEPAIAKALTGASSGDIFVTQNETNGQGYAMSLARDMGLRTCYAAAPFDAVAVSAVLPFLDILILNEVEAEQLEAALNQKIEDLPVQDVVVTLGSNGSRWVSQGRVTEFPAVKVDPVDTTGAGDTFTGYLLAALDRGQGFAQAINLASQAAALMVTRHGTADVIPDLKEVQDARLT